MGIGIDFIPPLIGPTWGNIVGAVPLHATSSHSDMFVDGVVGAVNRYAPKLALAYASHHMPTLSDVCADLKTLWIIFWITGVATELGYKEEIALIDHKNIIIWIEYLKLQR